MPQGALVFRWGPAVRGREQQGLEVFGESTEYFDDLQKNNRISGHYPYFSTNRNGGLWLLQGEIEDLQEIQREDDYERLTAAVQMIVEDYSAELCLGGSVDALGEAISIYGETAQRFG